MRPFSLAILVSLVAAFAAPVQAQAPPPRSGAVEVSGSVSVTTKGISVIPTFTLGRPATAIDVAIRRDRLSFEPEINYGLDDKPWTILFWGRYAAIRGRRFTLGIGGHPALSFSEVTTTTTAGTQTAITATR